MRDYWLTAAMDILSQSSPEVVEPPTAPTPAPKAEEPKTVQDAVQTMLIAAGPVGVFFMMVLFKFKLMTVTEHTSVVAAKDEQIASLEEDKTELKASLREANSVYTSQVIPTLTRVLDAERELVDLRRQEQNDARWRDQQRREGGGGSGGA